jgi:DNA-binding transcriptional ArsR family regulator
MGMKKSPTKEFNTRDAVNLVSELSFFTPSEGSENFMIKNERTEQRDEDLDVALRALADGQRRQIVRHLADHPSSATELAAAADSSVWMTPYQLRILKTAGLVSAMRHHRNRVSYRLNLDLLREIRDYLSELVPASAHPERPRFGAEAVVHRLPYPAWLLTKNLRSIAVNDPLCRLLDTPMQCLLDSSPFDFTDEPSGELLRIVMQQGGTREMPLVLHLAEDRRLSVVQTLTPLPSASEASAGWLMLVRAQD